MEKYEEAAIFLDGYSQIEKKNAWVARAALRSIGITRKVPGVSGWESKGLACI